LGKEYPGAKTAAVEIPKGFSHIDYSGTDGLLRAIEETKPDIVVNGIAGAAGLLPSVKALEAGADLALANKETIVMAAPLVFALAKKNGANIIPVDSEHSAVFHLIHAHRKERVEEIILTASGGPFRGYTEERLRKVGVREAMAHPTWNMGGKITIDSASLANKGLEVIEAVRLFGFPVEAVTVSVHPQSVVHSLVRLRDGSLYAQMSRPDMRVPIHNALFWPDCVPCPFGRLSLDGLSMTFEKPDTEVFRMLPLGYEAARLGACYPTAYNAADEIAVAAFISGRIGFLDIPRLTQAVLEQDWSGDDGDLDCILESDRRSRSTAEKILTEMTQ
jgi:1-deoxy-D-xylulose-5-phosphate reductoisomerase